MQSIDEDKEATRRAERVEDIVREMIKHEGSLTGNRITAFLATQALLFSAIGVVWEKAGHDTFVLIICAAGALVGTISAILINFGNRATVRLADWWEQFSPDDTGPGVIGLRPRKVAGLWVAIPTLAVVAWVLVWMSVPKDHDANRRSPPPVHVIMDQPHARPSANKG
jgi:hypothetical protein